MVTVLDTGTLILVVHVFASHLPDYDWCLQTRKNQFVNVSKIHEYIGNTVVITLPATFILTGCELLLS